MQGTVASLSNNHLFNIKYVDLEAIVHTFSCKGNIPKIPQGNFPTNSSSLLGGLVTTWEISCNLLIKKLYGFNNKKMFQRMQIESSSG